MKRSKPSGFTRYEGAPPCLPTGTDREMLAVWVVACVDHAAAPEARGRGLVVKIKDGIVNLQAFIMICRAVNPLRTLGAGLARHDRGKRAQRPFLDRRGKLRS
jgi:hypothetical protein